MAASQPWPSMPPDFNDKSKERMPMIGTATKKGALMAP